MTVIVFFFHFLKCDNELSKSIFIHEIIPKCCCYSTTKTKEIQLPEYYSKHDLIMRAKVYKNKYDNSMQIWSQSMNWVLYLPTSSWKICNFQVNIVNIFRNIVFYSKGNNFTLKTWNHFFFCVILIEVRSNWFLKIDTLLEEYFEFCESMQREAAIVAHKTVRIYTIDGL